MRNKKPVQLRQGDVFVERVQRPKGKLEKQPQEGGRVVLAHGEVTGHAHAVSGTSAVLYALAGVMYLRVLQRTKLLHEEHDPVELKPGWHRITRQREYAPEAPHSVAD
jgi:hypothetical protein